MSHAASGEKDAVIKAGNEFATRATTATQHLASMASQLRELVGRFKVEGGSAAKARRAHVPKAAAHAAGGR